MRAILLALLLAMTVLAGCADTGSDLDDPDDSDALASNLTSVFDRVDLPFNLTSDEMSYTLEQGPFAILDPVSIHVDIDLPTAEGGAATDPTTNPKVHLGIIMPDVPGCDFSDLDASTFITYEPGNGPQIHAERGVQDCKVPVIADVGPYWGESDVDAAERGSVRLGETLIQNFVPHGYAVAQVSVFGSGQSNHCFDMFGNAEQLGVAGAVEWLGAQDWSNGNVGLIGRSYDGSTPWMAAAHAPEALKTIVPISGLSGLGDLVTWNGASEGRVALFQNYIYAQFGLHHGVDALGLSADPSDDLPQQAAHRATCPDWVSSTAWGAEGYLAGGEMAEGDYWEERNFMPEVLENYNGSVYMIHGLLDDNVDPHAGWLAHQAIIEEGLETKGLYGQWYHSYPDRFREHGERGPSNSVRFDWTQDLLEWFDHYLKDIGDKPLLHVEVQQADGRWRLDDTLEPSSHEIVQVPISQTGIVQPGVGSLVFFSGPTPALEWDLGALDENNETLLGGLSTLNLEIGAATPTSQVYIELFDATEGTTFGLSYGITRLDRAVAGPEVPGAAGTYTIPLQYFAGALPAGHHLGLRLAAAGNDYMASPGQVPLQVGGGGTVLNLSTLPAEQAVFFEVPERAAEAEDPNA